MAVALVCLLVGLLIAGFTSIPGDVIPGVLSQQAPSEVELPKPFFPVVTPGQQVQEGETIGLQLRPREQEILETMAGWGDNPKETIVWDSLRHWRSELDEPAWFQLPERRSSQRKGIEILRGLQSELKQKQFLLQDTRVLWRRATSTQVREDAREKVLILEAECNRLTAQIEAKLHSSEKSPARSAQPVIPWNSLSRSADSLLRQSEVKAPVDGVLEKRSIPKDGGELIIYTVSTTAFRPYIFRSEVPSPDLDQEANWVLRSDDSEYPVIILGTEVGPRGSLLRLRADSDLEIDHEWELMAKEQPLDGILLRYWLLGFFL